MASSLFSNSNQSQSKSSLSSLFGIPGNPDEMFNSMMQSNPQFRDFVHQNQGKTPQQIAQEYGLDFNQVQHMFNQ